MKTLRRTLFVLTLIPIGVALPAHAEAQPPAVLCDTGTVSQPGIIGTFAGSGLAAFEGGGFGGDGGPADAALLKFPFGLAADDEYLYIADTNNHRVRRVSLATCVIDTVAGSGLAQFPTPLWAGDGGPATSAHLNAPRGLAIADGMLYISDTNNHRVRQVDLQTGIISTIAGTGDFVFNGDGIAAVTAAVGGPTQLAVADGMLYVVSGTQNRVRRIDLATGIIDTVAGNGQSGFSGDGGPATLAALDFPEGVAVGDGLLWIGARRVRQVDLSTGVITTVAGDGFNGLNGDDGLATRANLLATQLVYAGSAVLYIVDPGTSRVRKLDLVSGIISTVAGTGTGGFSGETGQGTSSALLVPGGIALVGSDLFISDTYNQRVRHLKPRNVQDPIAAGAPASAAHATVFQATATGGSGTGPLKFVTSGACTNSAGAPDVTMTSGSGTCRIVAVQVGDPDFDTAASPPVDVTATLGTQPTLVVSGISTGAPEGMMVTATTTGGAGSGAVTFAVSGACVNTGGSGTITLLGGPAVCTITASKAADENWEAATSAAFMLNVLGVQAPLSVVAPASAGYLNQFTATTSGGSGTGSVTFSVSGVCVNFSGGGQIIMTATTGTCQIVATKAADNSYQATTSAAAIVTATKGTQAPVVLTGAPVSAPNNTSFFVSAHGGSGTGALTITASGVCTIQQIGPPGNYVVNITSPSGTCAITATRAGDANYEPGSTVAQVLATGAIQPPLSVTNLPAVAAGGATLTASTTGGAGTGLVTFSVSGACTHNGNGAITLHPAPGVCTVTATKAADADFAEATSPVFSITVLLAQAPLSLAGAPASAGYATSFTLTANGGTGSGMVTFAATGSCSAVGGVVTMTAPSGTCQIVATKAGDGTYAPASATVVVTATKGPQNPLIVEGVPASAPYATVFFVAVTGGSGSGAVTVVPSGACAAINSNLVLMTAGTGTCQVVVTKAADANYETASVTWLVAAIKAEQAALEVIGPASGAAGSIIDVEYAGGDGTGDVSLSTSGACVVGARLPLIELLAGPDTCTVTVTKAGDANFEATTSAPFDILVTGGQAALRIVGAPARAAAYSGFSVTVEGGSGDGEVTINASGICEGDGTGGIVMTSGIGTCEITASKAADGAYDQAEAPAVYVWGLRLPQIDGLEVELPASAFYGSTFEVIEARGPGNGLSVFAQLGCANPAGDAFVTMTSGTFDCRVGVSGIADEFALPPQLPPTAGSRVAEAFIDIADLGVQTDGLLVYASNGLLYGRSSTGGDSGGGAVFQADPITGDRSILQSFNADRGVSPSSLIEGSDGYLYGTAFTGGLNGMNVDPEGTIFRLDPSSGDLMVLYSFDPTMGGSVAYPNGRNPVSLVESPNGKLLGVTVAGGEHEKGTVFAFDLATFTLSVLHAFDGADGDRPNSLMLANDGRLLGTTYEGGDHNLGTVFEIAADGTFTSLHSFAGTDGARPDSALTEIDGGVFYGTTRTGGAADLGTVFTLDSIGSFALHHEFETGEGANPIGPLAYAFDGYLYGVTAIPSGAGGTLFTIGPDGAFGLIDTSVGNAVVQGADGRLFGGGTTGIFHIPPVLQIVTAQRVPQSPLTIADAPESAANGTSFVVSASGGSGSGEVTFIVSGACTNDSGDSALITMTAGSGTCTITAAKSGDDDFDEVSSEAVEVAATDTPSTDPVIASVSPNTGTTTGGTIVIIQGRNFTPDAEVFFGETPAASVTVDSDTSLSAEAPPHGVALVDIVVFTDGHSRSVTAPAAFAYGPAPAIGLHGPLVRAAVASSGVEAGAPPLSATLAADGSTVAWIAADDEVVEGDINGRADVFVRDLINSTTHQANITSTGGTTLGAGPTGNVALTADGNVVIFTTGESLVPGDSNGALDVYAHDRVAWSIDRISMTADGSQLTSGVVGGVSVSANGRFVVFTSPDGITPEDTNGVHDVFVRDRWGGVTAMVSVATDGGLANGASATPWISADGRFVTFSSTATNLASGGGQNVYLRDRDVDGNGVFDEPGGVETRLVSAAAPGVGGNGVSSPGGVSADGRFVVFQSTASNLVAGDTNGQRDIFLFDRDSGAIARINLRSGGQQTDAASSVSPWGGAISGDGQFIVFTSSDAGLVPFDGNRAADVFRYDAVAGTIALVSADEHGVGTHTQGAGIAPTSVNGSISADGRRVLFASDATNLTDVDTDHDGTVDVDNDTNGVRDLFVKALQVNTPAGVATQVRPVDQTTGGSPVTLSFDGDEVVSEGTTTLTTIDDPPAPLPQGFSVGTVFYDIATTATLAGPVRICISYAGQDVGDESSLQLMHFENGEWVPITVPPVDTVNKVVCGETDSLSPFAIAKPTATSIGVAATASTAGGTTTLSALVEPAGADGTVSFSVNGGPLVEGVYDAPSGSAVLAGVLHGLPARDTPYDVRAVFRPAAINYAASEATASVLVVAEHAGTVSFDAASLSQVFDGSVKTVTTITDPPGLAVSVSFSGTPVNAGSYPVTATITHPGYAGAAAATLVIAPAQTTTVPEDATVNYSAASQVVTLVAAVVAAAPGPTSFDGTVVFAVLDGSTEIGSVGPVTYAAGRFKAELTLPAGTGAGSYVIRAQFTGGGNYSSSQAATATLQVTPVGTGLLGEVAGADADFKHIEGFDVLFGNGPGSSLRLKNTKPGTFHYRLTLTNETGVELHPKNVPVNDAHGGTVTAYIQMPSLPANVGTPIPASVLAPYNYTLAANSAFSARGNKPVKVHPDDRTDEMPVSVKWIGSLPSGVSQCSDVPDPATGSLWNAGQPADGTVIKCVMIEGMAIPKRGKARVSLHLELAIKDTDNWAANAQTAFRAGFAFRSTEVIRLDSTFPIPSLAGRTYTGSQAAGLVGTGQQVTAIGGFVFDDFGNGLSRDVRIFAAPPASCAAPGAVASVQTMTDGFYFAEVPDGTTWWVGVCNPDAPGYPNVAPESGRFLAHKLAKKEFAAEDFYIDVP